MEICTCWSNEAKILAEMQGAIFKVEEIILLMNLLLDQERMLYFVVIKVKNEN